ncbi:hypothetical protein L1049_024743 [Liquidambar formosana]|uniref:Uncharacterized protein n=1 Tax=Liquidambar formosana TaxID=63359 RepID=A0AAP0X4Z4_LIQFO
MSKGPGLFSDIGKKAKDLLTKDYSSDQKFTVSTYSEAGVGFDTLSFRLMRIAFESTGCVDCELGFIEL